jgi:hypothetical protein
MNITNGTITTTKIKKDWIPASGSTVLRACQRIQTVATARNSGTKQRRISSETLSKANPVMHQIKADRKNSLFDPNQIPRQPKAVCELPDVAAKKPLEDDHARAILL